MSDEIRYPVEDPPAAGGMIDIAPGIKWLRMPLPIALDHINLYLVDASDGWLIVDTGMQLDVIKAHWEALFAGDALEGKPVKGVLVTHMHPDHVGLAGWLCERWRVPLYMSREEYFYARALSAPRDRLSWTSEEFFKRTGLDDLFLKGLEKNMQSFGSVVAPLPGSFHRLVDGQVLQLGEHSWQVVIGRGHAVEHVCLYCEALNVLISGDQVIAKISSNVSVMATEPEANPLAEWLDSHQRFLKLPADLLVLPAHNKPFYGLHARLNELIAHHEDHLLAIEEACVEAKSATELLPVLFQRELDNAQMGMAVGECIAHLHYLMAHKRIDRQLDSEGVYRYKTLDPAVKGRSGRRHTYIDDEPIMV
jgi:glyoxylase-like metal-dependent hydrolase (beta-lactamase superfamily II)